MIWASIYQRGDGMKMTVKVSLVVMIPRFAEMGVVIRKC